jgi:hypothetical protein
MTTKPCPFCSKPLPTPVYDETTHTTDLTPVTNHLNSCSYKIESDNGAAYE